jgi:hypothetical protein
VGHAVTFVLGDDLGGEEGALIIYAVNGFFHNFGICI